MSKKNKEIVRMTYPDGSVHEVTFNGFCPIKIGNICCYIATYHDNTFNADMITLITNQNDQWNKIPLTPESYYYLNIYYQTHRDEILPANEYTLGDEVHLGEGLELVIEFPEQTVEYPKPRDGGGNPQPDWPILKGPGNNTPNESSLILLGTPPGGDDSFDPSDKEQKKPSFKIVGFRKKLFVPINASKGLFNPKNAFKSDSAFHYEKTKISKLLEDTIRYGVTHYRINDHGVKEYDCVCGYLESVDNKKPIEKDESVMPGPIYATIYYSDFVDEEDYELSKKSNNIFVKGKDLSLDYADYIWKEAGQKNMPMSFDTILDVKKR